MISKDMIYGIALLMIICGIIKAYILKIRLTPKDKILLTYTPTHLFFLVNILFVISSLNMLYVIFMKPNAVYQDWSHFYMASIIFIWYAIIAFGRRMDNSSHRSLLLSIIFTSIPTSKRFFAR